jgi:DNA-binding GntR family transcriptional regulator
MSVNGSGAPTQLDDVLGDFKSREHTLGQSVLDVLRKAILQGTFQPGERLRQEELGRRLGVSRIPVRSALMQLEAEGLVTFEPYRGATVRRLSVERTREIFELRILLEAHVIRLAIRNLSTEAKQHAVKQGKLLDSRSHEGPDFRRDRTRFYHALYDADRNVAANEMIDHLRTAIGRHQSGLRIGHGSFTHEALARAVQCGDESAAVELISEHLSDVCDQMVSHANGNGSPSD